MPIAVIDGTAAAQVDSISSSASSALAQPESSDIRYAGGVIVATAQPPIAILAAAPEFAQENFVTGARLSGVYPCLYREAIFSAPIENGVVRYVDLIAARKIVRISY
jgi:hypothetical protein